MKYLYKSIKSITKFSVLDFGSLENASSRQIKLSGYFWDTVFNLEFFKNFVETKYKPFKQSKESLESYNFFLKEYEYILNNLSFAKDGINIKKRIEVPNGAETVYAFRIFSTILSYYNEYYYESGYSIILRFGIFPHKEVSSLDEFFYLASEEYSYKNRFIEEMILPLFKKLGIESQETSVVYKFEIFWPNEFLLVSSFSSLIRHLNPQAKIVLDMSNANEQFDFTQWGELIKKSGNKFFSLVDFFIVNRDFGKGIHDIFEYLYSDKKTLPLNVLYFKDNQVYFHDIETHELSEEMFQKFIEETYNPLNIVPVLTKNAIFARFLPYKCYWNNCSFCAINSNNKFVYDRKYGYDFFIDKWIQFIEENNIFSINFKDEAIPPSVIIKFAKKVIAKNISINYQFRTRYDALFTKENCMILGLSGARYVGLGLESAVDRVNQEIGNKGNNDVSIGEKMKIIRYFEMAGVSIHNYCILGFPRETDDEIKTTYSFLISNIKKSNYFTCTPNFFSLMKGPRIFREREKYGVEISQNELVNPFKLSYDFTVDGKPRSMDLLRFCEREIHRTQFLPWIDKDNTSIHPRDFWDFIDRSFLFYLMKRYHKTNPYYTYMNTNSDIIGLPFQDIIQKKFVLSRFLQIYDPFDNQIYVYNWVECSHFKIDNQIKTLFTTFDDTKTLSENLKKHNLESRQDIVYGFLKNRTFLYKQV